MARIPVLMSDKRYDEITQRVKETFPKSCICFIDEVQNGTVYLAYENRKKLAPKAEEVQAFHGTHAGIIDIIAQEGFNPAKNVVSAYGHGTYFSTTAHYSFHYMKSPDKTGISYMFFADVLVGAGGANKFSNILVAPLADQAYPRYIIAFHKEAN